MWRRNKQCSINENGAQRSRCFQMPGKYRKLAKKADDWKEAQEFREYFIEV